MTPVHNIAAGGIAKHDITLQAGTVHAVNFEDDPVNVEIVTDGVAKIYVTVDGTQPAVGGDNTYIVPATGCARTIRHNHHPKPVLLLSPGAPTISVTAV